MKIARESIFISVTRSFFVAFFAVFGIVVALAIAGLFFSGTSKPVKTSSHFQPTVLPDAQAARLPLASTTPLILQIDISGFIGSEELNSDSIQGQLDDSQGVLFDKGRVKGVLLNINSQGGGAITSYTIYQAIQTYKKQFKVPVYAFVDGLAASGGYQIACAADKIYASEVSLIGSVGVIINMFNVSELLKKIGVEPSTLTEGKNKDLMNPFRPWKPGEEAPLKEITEFYYNSFIDIVTANRPQLSKKSLVNTYGANIYPAPDAQEYHYIDKAGVTWRDTLSELAKEAKIDKEKYQVVQLRRKLSINDFFNMKNWLFSGNVNHTFPQLPPHLNANNDNQILYLYQFPTDATQ